MSRLSSQPRTVCILSTQRLFADPCLDAASLQWRLGFEFVVGRSGELWEQRDECVASAPTHVAAEVLHWTLPILVLPTNPVNVPASIVEHHVVL